MFAKALKVIAVKVGLLTSCPGLSKALKVSLNWEEARPKKLTLPRHALFGYWPSLRGSFATTTQQYSRLRNCLRSFVLLLLLLEKMLEREQ